MTVKERQLLLSYVSIHENLPACNPGGIDGQWGAKSIAACKVFQTTYGLVADGICGPETEKMLIGVIAGTVAKKVVAPTTTNNVTKPTTPAPSNVTGNAEQYLRADGCYHIPRGVDVQLSKNLWAHEIHCQGTGCCTESIISKRIVSIYQEIRDDIDEPLEVATAGGSGYRCPKRNADPSVKGAANSLHVSGRAVDIHYHKSPAKLKSVVLRHLTNGEVGLYSWGCHVGEWDRGYVSQFTV